MRRRRRRNVRALLTGLIAVALGPLPSADAVPGDLDPAYGVCGLDVTADLGAHGVATDAAAHTENLFVVGTSRSTLDAGSSRLAATRVAWDGTTSWKYVHGSVSQGTSTALQPTVGNERRLLVGGVVDGTASVVGLHEIHLGIDGGWSGDGVAALTGSVPVSDLVVDATRRTYAVAGDQIFRLTSSGAFDTSWANDGSATATFRVTQVAIGSDGIWVAGEDTSTAPPTSWKLQRYNAALGIPDPTFNGGAPVTTTFASPPGKTLVQLAAAELVLQAGKPVIGGTAYFTTTTAGADAADFAFARYTTAGALDNTFADGGRALIHAAFFETLHSLLVDDQGRLVAGGGGFDLGGAGGEQAVLARVTAGGALDPSFGIAAEAARHDLGGNDRVVGLAEEDDGDVILAGVGIDLDQSHMAGGIAVQTQDEIPAAWTLDGGGGLGPVAVDEWMGGRHPACVDDGPAFGFDIANDAALIPGQRVGFVLDGYGGLHGFGPGQLPPPAPATSPYFGFDIARALELRDDGGGYVLDGYGGLHPVSIGSGTAPGTGSGPYFGWDIARDIVFTPNGNGAYLLDGFGGVHPIAVGGNPQPPAVGNAPYFGFDIARQLVLNAAGTGGYVLDGYGGIHSFSTGSNPVPMAASGGPYFGFDIARDLVLDNDHHGHLLDGHGGIHSISFGSPDEGPSTMSGPYYGVDVARALVVLPAPALEYPQAS